MNKLKKRPITKLVTIIMVSVLFLCSGCSGVGGGNSIEGTYVYNGNPSSSIVITDTSFSWYIDAFGGYYQIEDSSYTIDEENSLILVDDSEFPFCYETDDSGNIVWIARLVNGVTQEKHYK